MTLFNSFTVLAKISLVILVLKLTITVNNGREIRGVKVGRVDTKVICQGKSIRFKCENSSLVMVIHSATYGRQELGRTLCPFRQTGVDPSVIKAKDIEDDHTCPERNVTKNIMDLCDKKRKCIVTVNETYFWNHCSGIYKVLKIIYACEEKDKIRTTTLPFFTPHTPDSTEFNISPTPGTSKKPKTPRVTTARKRETTLTKRKTTRTVNSTFRKKTAPTTKTPKVTKHSTAPSSSSRKTSKRPPRGTYTKITKELTTTAIPSKRATPTTAFAVSRRQTTRKRRRKTTRKPRTVSSGDSTLTPEVSVPITIPVAVTTSTLVTTEQDKTIKTLTTSAGVLITNGTNCTLPNNTEPVTEKPQTHTTPGEGNGGDRGNQPSLGPTPGGVASGSPVIMAQESQAAVMGMAGSLYLWFLHMKENKSAYVTVFILSALGAALVMVAVASCFLTVGKKKEFLKLDIMHKPKRFIALPKEAKKSNQNGEVPGKDEKEADGEEAPDGSLPRKGPEVVFTAHDVTNLVKKEFNIERCTRMENGTANKGGAASIHINPMFNGGNKNKPPIIITNQPQVIPPVNDGVSSLPSTPARVRTQSEPRTGTSRRTRANSTGNVSRSHERNQNQGLADSYERVRIPRHLSAGNVSHQQRQGAHSGNDQFCHSPVRNHLQLPQGGGATLSLANGASEIINNGPQQHSPSRSIPNGSVVNQYPSTSGHRPQIQGGIARQFSPSKSPQHGPFGQPVNSAATVDYQCNTLSAMPAETQSGSAAESSLPHLRAKQTPPTKLSNSTNTPLGEEKNLGAQTSYSSHQETGKATRNWGEEETLNAFVPNITTNPSFNKSQDLWQKPKEATIGKKESSTRLLGSDRHNIPGDVLQRGSISSETSTTHERNASKEVENTKDNFDDLQTKKVSEISLMDKILGMPRSLFGK